MIELIDATRWRRSLLADADHPVHARPRGARRSAQRHPIGAAAADDDADAAADGAYRRQPDLAFTALLQARDARREQAACLCCSPSTASSTPERSHGSTAKCASDAERGHRWAHSGEAACLTVVSREPLTPHFVVVRGLELGTETATAANEEPFRADGLMAALELLSPRRALGCTTWPSGSATLPASRTISRRTRAGAVPQHAPDAP